MFITPYNPYLKRENYFSIKEGETDQGFVITEIDINSTPGVEYVSVDPTFLRSEPQTLTEDRDSELYWLDGGVAPDSGTETNANDGGGDNGSP